MCPVLMSSHFSSEPQNEDQIYYWQMIYTRPYYRMGAYLIGISAGELLLHKPKLNRVSTMQLKVQKGMSVVSLINIFAGSLESAN